MKVIRIAILCLFLAGCITNEYDYKITHPDVMYVGDSLCYKVCDTDDGIEGLYENEDHMKTAERESGIRINCVPGRKSTDIDELPDGQWRVMFLALGTNDVRNTPMADFRMQYKLLVDSADTSELYCVLPNTKINGIDAEPYRQVIRDICTNTIDPLEHGVRFRAKDGVHKTKADQPGWWMAIMERI